MKKTRKLFVLGLALLMVFTIVPPKPAIAQEVVISCPARTTGKCHKILFIGWIACCYFTGGQNDYCGGQSCGGRGTPRR